MANILKFKLATIAVSISILTLIPLFKSNFNAPVTIKPWQQLTWGDFQGFVKPFTGWAAGISTNIYLELDSSTMSYYAYAGQNNQQSWTKSSSTKSDYLLNHEQYHFNITEVHARRMNAYISNNEDLSGPDLTRKLVSIREELNAMQDRYDNESDHSLNRDQQRYWEYKVDSLLLQYSGEPTMFTDYYSGAQAFFPAAPELVEGRSKEANYRAYMVEKYDVSLHMFSFQFAAPQNEEAIVRGMDVAYKTDSLKITSIAFDSTKYGFEATVHAVDSVELMTYRDLYVYQNNYLFMLRGSYPTRYSAHKGYKKIVRSFVNSFKVVETNDYWISRIEKNDLIKNETPKKLIEGVNCFSYGESDQYGFYTGPFYRDNGGLVLVYNITELADSLVHNNVLIVNDEEVYLYEPDSVDNIFYLSPGEVPDLPFQIRFGCLSKDSTEKCFEFYHQSLVVDKGPLLDSLEDSQL